MSKETRMTTMFNDVKHFHVAFGHAVGKRPRMIEPERMANRIKWTEEEIEELKEAVAKGSIVDVADALADIIYFCLGTAVEMGLPFDDVWQAVQSANMRKAKFLPHRQGCPLRVPVEVSTVECSCTCGAIEYGPNGKTKKPADWYPPEDDIALAIKWAEKEADDITNEKYML